jgi:hypothetical protein
MRPTPTATSRKPPGSEPVEHAYRAAIDRDTAYAPPRLSQAIELE